MLDDVIEDTEYVIPGLRDKVVYKELATPRSLSKYTLNPEGSIMGWSYDMYQTPLYGRFGSSRHRWTTSTWPATTPSGPGAWSSPP